MEAVRLIDLATRIQRRRDFVAHLIGFIAGVSILTGLHLASARTTTMFLVSILVWAAALSCQHFRHVLQGGIIRIDSQREQARLLRQANGGTSRLKPGPHPDTAMNGRLKPPPDGRVFCETPRVRQDEDLFDVHRQRRRSAYEHAAGVHDRAALVHEAAAIFFEREKDHDAATRERSLARQDEAAAERDRARASEAATAQVPVR